MTEVHVVGAVIVLVAATLFFILALAVARSGSGERLLAGARRGLAAVVGLQLLLGLLLLVQGRQPAEGLHFLYAGVALGAVPGAAAFASEAPPKARAGALAAGAGLTLIMIWRLWVTGSG